MRDGTCHVIEIGGHFIGYIQRNAGLFKCFVTKFGFPGENVGEFQDYEMALSAVIEAHQQGGQSLN